MDVQTQSREESSSRQLPHPMHILKNILFQGLALLAVFALAFLIRASAYDLPSVIYADQQYLQDESGNPYLSEMDSYFYLRKAQEMAGTDTASWYVDRDRDPMIGARTHDRETGDTLPLGLSAFAYLIWKHLLSRFGFSLYQTSIWLGPVLGSLAVVPAFFYVRKRTSIPGGIAAAVLTGCAIPFVIHTTAGFFDTDMVLAVLPLTAILAHMRCMSAARLKEQSACAALSAAAFACMSLCWKAHYAYFLFTAACTAAALVLTRLVTILLPREYGRELPQDYQRELPQDDQRELPQDYLREHSRGLIRGAVLSLSLSVLLLLLAGGSVFVRQILGIVGAYRTASGDTGAMPYALEFISEMQRLSFLPALTPSALVKADLSSVLGRMGGALPVLLAVGWFPLEAVLLVLDAKRLNKTGEQELYTESTTRQAPDSESSISLKKTSGQELYTESTTQQAPDPESSISLKKTSEQKAKHRFFLPEDELVPLILELVFLGTWMAGGAILTCRARRFAEIAVLPVGILCGLLIGRLFCLADRMKKGRRNKRGRLTRKGRRRMLCRLAVTGLLCLMTAAVVYPVFSGARRSATTNRSLVTDAKCEAMTWIRDNTPENTVLASWWDDGYYLEYQARRRTLSDGGSDSGALSWMMARVLLTDDPKLMRGILRMLNESGTDALDVLTGAGLAPGEAADLLFRILPMERDGAEEELRRVQKQDHPDIPVAKLLDKTHPADPEPLMLVLNSDMIRIYNSLAYFGFWDPEAGAQSQNAFMLPSSFSVELPDTGENEESEEDDIQIDPDAAESEDADAQEPVEIPMTDGQYSVTLSRDPQGRITAQYTDHGEQYTPSRIVIWENGQRIRDDRQTGLQSAEDMEEQASTLALVLVKEEEQYSALLCSENICDSVLIRLLAGEDRTMEEAEYRGTWYGTSRSDVSAVQKRINSDNWQTWTVQAWQIRQ